MNHFKEIYFEFVQLSKDIDEMVLDIDRIFRTEYYRRLCILRNMKNLSDKKFFQFDLKN
jgi:hypothetical protein